MTITELGALGEFVGAFAVVATLAYLAIQVRQNTGMMRAQIYQARSDAGQRYQLFVAGSEEMSEILERISDDQRLDPAKLGTLTPVERRRLRFLQTAHQQRLGNVFFQYQNGLLDEDFWTALKPTIRSNAPVWEELGGIPERSSFKKEVARILSEAAP